MSAPHVDQEAPAESTAVKEPPQRVESQPTKPSDHKPVFTASERDVVLPPSTGTVGEMWRGVPQIVRTSFVQLAVALAVVLIMLPLASTYGWFGLHNVAPGTSTTTQQTTTSNLPSPNAPAHTLYDPQAPVTPAGSVVNVNLTVKDTLVSIESGIAYHAWAFNGTVPGPVIRVRQGQTVHFTLTNASAMSHSIDFHAAQTAWNVNYQPVAPGKSLTFDWTANYPGVFLYHCGTPPVMEHMANGMYGAIIVDPANGWATPAQEYVLVQSEFYTKRGADGDYSLDSAKMMTGMPDYVTFNGYASQYTQAPLTAKPGQRIRLFVVNAGPTHFSAFHVIGAIFSDSYVDGNPANHEVGNQTLTIPPGGGAVAELTIPDAGSYPFVTHSFMDASVGAVGMIKVAP